MYKLVDEENNTIHTGTRNDMELALDYLTLPAHLLSEKRGLISQEIYMLNSTYWTDAAKNAKGKLRLVPMESQTIPSFKHAISELRKSGHVPILMHIDDVQELYKCTDEQAFEILETVSGYFSLDDHIRELIHNEAEFLELSPKL